MPGLHWLLGCARLRQGDVDEALREFDCELDHSRSNYLLRPRPLRLRPRILNQIRQPVHVVEGFGQSCGHGRGHAKDDDTPWANAGASS